MSYRCFESTPFSSENSCIDHDVYVWKIASENFEQEASMQIIRYILARNSIDAINAIEVMNTIGGDDGYRIISVERFTDAVYAASNVELIDRDKLREWRDLQDAN